MNAIARLRLEAIAAAGQYPDGSALERPPVGARLRLEAIAAAGQYPDGSALERPPVGVGGIGTSSISIQGCCHLPLEGEPRLPHCNRNPLGSPFRGAVTGVSR